MKNSSITTQMLYFENLVFSREQKKLEREPGEKVKRFVRSTRSAQLSFLVERRTGHHPRFTLQAFMLLSGRHAAVLHISPILVIVKCLRGRFAALSKPDHVF